MCKAPSRPVETIRIRSICRSLVRSRLPASRFASIPEDLENHCLLHVFSTVVRRLRARSLRPAPGRAILDSTATCRFRAERRLPMFHADARAVHRMERSQAEMAATFRARIRTSRSRHRGGAVAPSRSDVDQNDVGAVLASAVGEALVASPRSSGAPFARRTRRGPYASADRAGTRPAPTPYPSRGCASSGSPMWQALG